MNKDTTSQEYLDLKAELRSILISSQQGCNELQLMRDYGAYNAHKPIPFRDMGYNTLIDLLKSMPDVAKIDQSRGPMIIHGVPDENTAHIKKLVMTQKRNKKKANVHGGMARNYYTNNRSNGPSMYPRFRQATSYFPSNGVPFQPFNQTINAPRNIWDAPYVSPAPFTTITHAINGSVRNPNPQTLIGVNKPLMSTEKTVASFPPKENRTPPPLMLSSEMTSIRATPTNDDMSSVMDGDLNYSEDDELAAYDAQLATEHGEKIVLLRKRIRQLLLRYSTGLWLSNIHKLYKKSFDEEMNLEEFKLKNLMAFFDCISDFVDSQRDRLVDSTDRILLLKPNFTEVVKREQQTSSVDQKSESTAIVSNPRDNQTPPRSIIHEIDRPIVDRSSFVPYDFQYKSIEYTSNEPFHGFLGHVEDPWNIHIGNIQFIPKRDQMMVELQDHYNQSSNQSIYVIPFEQIEVHLPCVYYHTADKKYYRSYIYNIDSTPYNDIIILKVYLVDYGMIIPDIKYHNSSTNIQFLHRNFSTLSTQVYDCRLANVSYPPTSIQWPEDARQFIIDLCDGINFTIEIVGVIDSFYSIYLWIDQQSINQLLIHHGFAIENDDSQDPKFQSLSSNVNNNNYIDEKLFSREEQHNLEYNIEENNSKYFIISIEHAYHFIKHPYTRRPCLPCFEVARLLNKDETFVSQLNLIREQPVYLKDYDKTLFDDLRCLNQSSQCPHIHKHDDQAMIIIYDLSSIRDYLLKIKFKEGDVIDAFQQEYDNYERPGYWNEKKNSYNNRENLETHQEDLYQRRNILNFRKEQLVSLSKTSPNNFSTINEMQTIANGIDHINHELHTMETIIPPLPNDHHPTIKFKSTNNKMRDTLYRIARPFDQQFSLNIRFNHQVIDIDQLDLDDEIEERFQDLYRITKNVIQFFILESEIPDEKNRVLLTEAENLSPDLIQTDISLHKRIEIYNYCLQIIEYLQPLIRYYVQRTDLIDTIF